MEIDANHLTDVKMFLLSNPRLEGNLWYELPGTNALRFRNHDNCLKAMNILAGLFVKFPYFK